MSRYSIKLNIDGVIKEFQATNDINDAIFKRSLELDRVSKRTDNPEVIIKKLYPLICEVFGNQFTPSQLKEGLDKDKALSVGNEAIKHCITVQLMKAERGPTQ